MNCKKKKNIRNICTVKNVYMDVLFAAFKRMVQREIIFIQKYFYIACEM